MLYPVDESQPVIPQTSEVSACEWIPIENILNQPYYAPSTVFGVAFRSALAICNSKRSGSNEGRDTSFHIDNEFVSLHPGLSVGNYPLGFGRNYASLLYSNFSRK